MKATRTCKIDGCDRPIRGRGWCQTHYMRWWKTGDAGSAKIDPQMRGTCAVEGCDRPHHCHTWCRVHYLRWKRTGSLAGQTVIETCTIDGCDHPHRSRGWCNMHYLRWRLNGDPNIVLSDRGQIGVRHYSSHHQWLKKVRGRARDHTCVSCGRQAAHWAYDHRDPDELIDRSLGRPLRYSRKAEHYQPMCISCHWAFDGRTKRKG